MKTIIAGSRTIDNFEIVTKAIEDSKFEITEVICGAARGIDACGAAWALKNNIPIKYFKADWNKYHKGAGMIRNREMGNYADALIAIWDGKSHGTKQMIEYARAKGLKVSVKIV